MAIVVIETQVYENYAAHDWDGVTLPVPQYWKAKGGHSYKVQVDWDVDYEWAEVMMDRVVDEVRSHVEEDSDYYREQIIGVHVQADGWLSWFERSQLEYDGEIRYPEKFLEIGKKELDTVAA